MSPVGTLQVNTDGTAIVDGAKYQCLVDDQSFVLTGIGDHSIASFEYLSFIRRRP